MTTTAYTLRQIGGAGLIVTGIPDPDQPEPLPQGGYGGRQIVQRAGKAGLTTYQGRAPFTVDLSMILDGFAAQRPVEGDCLYLELLATAPPDQDDLPLVAVDGPVGIIPPRSSAQWTIEDLTWGACERLPNGSRCRQYVTVHLQEDVRDELLQESTFSSRSHGQTIVRHVTVRKGDTLQKIAARELGSASRWVDIAALNGLRSSGQLKVGRRLKLP